MITSKFRLGNNMPKIDLTMWGSFTFIYIMQVFTNIFVNKSDLLYFLFIQ